MLLTKLMANVLHLAMVSGILCFQNTTQIYKELPRWVKNEVTENISQVANSTVKAILHSERKNS